MSHIWSTDTAYSNFHFFKFKKMVNRFSITNCLCLSTNHLLHTKQVSQMHHQQNARVRKLKFRVLKTGPWRSRAPPFTDERMAILVPPSITSIGARTAERERPAKCQHIATERNHANSNAIMMFLVTHVNLPQSTVKLTTNALVMTCESCDTKSRNAIPSF